MIKIQITEDDIGQRIDIAIQKKAAGELSRRQFQKLVKSDLVFINDEALSDYSKKIKKPCEITIALSALQNMDCENSPPTAENIPLNIIYEDEHIIVLNKPSGMVCHPAPGHYTGTLVNAILWHCGVNNLSDCAGNILRPGIVHRLDKDTSGLMIVAKNNAAHKKLAEYFANEKGISIIRKYKCLTFTSPQYPKIKNGTVTTFIQRDRKDRQKYIVCELSGKLAITKYNTINSIYITSNKSVSVMECELFTGRTHQIRVHMKYIGCPIVGDPIYGKKKIENIYPKQIRYFPRTALHSYYLEFIHPISLKHMYFESEMPEDMLCCIRNGTP